MRVIHDLTQLEREELKDKHSKVVRNACIFDSHFVSVIDNAYCYKAELSTHDYKKIWIHACIEVSRSFPYITLAETIDYISEHPSFLETTNCGCLNGQQVQHYVNELANNERNFESLADCFLLDKTESKRIEVTDGMHRLVAYGLLTNIQEQYFPIQVLLGTTKTQQEVELL